MNYSIKLHNPLTHFIAVELTLTCSSDKVDLYLPMWRPGRYEAANYAKNVRDFTVTSTDGTKVKYIKTSPSSWELYAKTGSKLIVSYNYFAFQMDAGNSYYDTEQLYINFINCLMYDIDQMDQSCQVDIALPEGYEIACGLKQNGNTLIAKDYYELVDSPMIASKSLQHYSYDVDEIDFHIWIQGECQIDREKLVGDFKKFSEVQVKMLDGFPESSYHFLIHALPYKFYHGVEHHDSTVICLGPGHLLETEELYSQLLGVSSHELFHSWNIIRIRPKELMPYQFNEPVFFPTGFVAEGFTTYYGDLFLSRGGVFDTSAYFAELNTLFKRHFLNFGRRNYSVYNSSLDLWIDGYALSTPDRKSSIYVEGAMVALCLDMMIRQKWDDKKSLDDVVKQLWINYGKTNVGYTYEDIIKLCEEVYEGDLQKFFDDHVAGTEDKTYLISELLQHVGCRLTKKPSESDLEKYFGMRLADPNGTFKITQIAPNSPAEQYFSINDVVVTINGKNIEMENINQFDAGTFDFKIMRGNREMEITLATGEAEYFSQYIIEPLSLLSTKQKSSFKAWTGCILEAL